MVHLGDKTWWIEHFSRPPRLQALLDVRAKFAAIEAKTTPEKRKMTVLIVLSEGTPRALEDNWRGLSAHEKSPGIWEMLGAIPTYWVDTKQVSPDYFPLASLALDPDPRSNWARVAEAMIRAQDLEDDKAEDLWEVLMGAVHYNARERFVDQLRRSQREGLQEGLERGREEGLERGREEGLEQGLEEGRELGAARMLVAGLEGRFTSAYQWEELVQRAASVPVSRLANALATETADEAFQVLVDLASEAHKPS